MFITLTTYEHPAARHMIDDWRTSMGAKIVQWDGELGGVEIATIRSNELLFIVPIVNGLSDENLGTALALINKLTGYDWLDKLLHFGKVPSHDPMWRQLLDHVRVVAKEPKYGPRGL